MRNKALCGVISLKAENDALIGFKPLAINKPKTKDAVSFLDTIQAIDKKVLLVINERDTDMEKSFANIPTVKQVHVEYLNPVDIMQAHMVLVAEDAFDIINSD